MKAINSTGLLTFLLVFTQFITSCGDNAQVRAIRDIDADTDPLATCSIALQAFFPEGDTTASVNLNVEGSFYSLKNYQKLSHNLNPDQCKDNYLVDIVSHSDGYTCIKENVQVENKSINNGIIRCSKQTFSISGSVTGIAADHFSGDSVVYNQLNDSEQASWTNANAEFLFENIPFGHQVQLNVSGLDNNYAYHCTLIADGQNLSGAITVLKNYENAELNCVRDKVKIKGTLKYSEANQIPAQALLDDKEIKVVIAGGSNIQFLSANLNQATQEQTFEIFVPKNLGAYTMQVQEDLDSHSCAADGFDPSGSEINESMESQEFNFNCSVQLLSIQGQINGLPAGTEINLASNSSAEFTSGAVANGATYQINNIPYGHLYQVQLTDLINYPLPQGYQCGIVNGGDGTQPLVQNLDNVAINCSMGGPGSGVLYKVSGEVIGLNQGSIRIYEVSNQSQSYIAQMNSGQNQPYSIDGYQIPQGATGFDVHLKLDLSQTNMLCHFASTGGIDLILNNQSADITQEQIVCGAAPAVMHNVKVSFAGTVAPTNAIAITLDDINNANNNIAAQVEANQDPTFSKEYVHGSIINFSYQLVNGDMSQYICITEFKEGQNFIEISNLNQNFTVENPLEFKVTCEQAAPANTYTITVNFDGEVAPVNSIFYQLSSSNQNYSDDLLKSDDPAVHSFDAGSPISFSYQPSQGSTGQYNCSAVDANNAPVGANFTLNGNMSLTITCSQAIPVAYNVKVSFVGDIAPINEIRFDLEPNGPMGMQTLAKDESSAPFPYAIGTSVILTYEHDGGNQYNCVAKDQQQNPIQSGDAFIVDGDKNIIITCSLIAAPSVHTVKVHFLGDLNPNNEIESTLKQLPLGLPSVKTVPKGETHSESYNAGSEISFHFTHNSNDPSNCMAYELDQNQNAVTLALPFNFTLNQDKTIYVKCVSVSPNQYSFIIKLSQSGIGNTGITSGIIFDQMIIGGNSQPTISLPNNDLEHNYGQFNAGSNYEFRFMPVGSPMVCTVVDQVGNVLAQDLKIANPDNNPNSYPPGTLSGQINSNTILEFHCNQITSNSGHSLNIKKGIFNPTDLNIHTVVCLKPGAGQYNCKEQELNSVNDFYALFSNVPNDTEFVFKYEAVSPLQNSSLNCTIYDEDDQGIQYLPGESSGEGGILNKNLTLVFDCDYSPTTTYSLKIEMGVFNPVDMSVWAKFCYLNNCSGQFEVIKTLSQDDPNHIIYSSIPAGQAFIFKYEDYEHMTGKNCKMFDKDNGDQYFPVDDPHSGTNGNTYAINKNLTLVFHCSED
jgi:hypothetical protein